MKLFDESKMKLIPGNFGKDCPANGLYIDEDGELIECCCDECDYLMCCTEELIESECKRCKNRECPHHFKERIVQTD